MWPWGHLAIGYVCYSLTERTLGDRPDGAPTLVAIVGSQTPDLIDKPLSWSLDLLSSGYGPGHSLVVAIPGLLGVLAVTDRWGYLRYGLAFAVGYLSHVLADLGLAVLLDKQVTVGRVVWPFGPSHGYPVDRGLVGRFLEYFIPFAEAILTGEATGYLVVYLVLFTGVLVLWAADGFPVARELVEYSTDADH